MNYTQFFTSLGKLVKWNNLFSSYQANTLLGTSGAASDIQSGFTATPMLLNGLDTSVQGWAQQVGGWESQLLQTFATNLLASIQGEINSSSSTAASIVTALYLNMVANGQTINRNTTTIASVASSTNVGNGSVLVSALNKQTGINDERLLNEVVRIVCVTDVFTAALAGAESWSITGYPVAQPFTTQTPGSGSIANQLQTADQSNQNILTNGSFDSYSNGSFNGWTVEVLPVASYYGGYTYTNGTVESLISPLSTAVATDGSQAITWTIPAPPSGYSVNIYMTQQTGAVPFLQVSQVADVYSITEFVDGRLPPSTSSASFGPLSATAAPTLTAVTGTGVAATYYGTIFYNTASGSTVPSPESTLTTTSAQQLQYASPAAVNGATSWGVGASTASGSETIQANDIPIGTAWTMPSTGLIAGSAMPSSNTATWNAPTAAPTGAAYTPGNSVSQSLNYTAVQSGGASMALTPNTGGDIVISQGLTGLNLIGMWALAGYLNAQSLTSGSVLTIDVEDFGGGSTMTLFSADPSTLAATFTIQDVMEYFSTIIPPAVLRIRWSKSSAQGANAVIYFDAFSLIAATEFGNWNIAIERGTKDFRVGDTFTVTTTNNKAGVFQTYIGSNYDAYLPSSTTPAIADSLAT